MLVIVQSTISMHSILTLRGLGVCLSQENFWKTDPLRLNLRAFKCHSHACYISYMTLWLYCVDGSVMCMLILCCCICSIQGVHNYSESRHGCGNHCCNQGIKWKSLNHESWFLLLFLDIYKSCGAQALIWWIGIINN